MTEVIIANIVNILGAALIALIGVLGAWLTAKIGKKTELVTINEAQQEVIRLAQITVGELQQTVVENLKASHADGKLTKEEIAALGNTLIEKVFAKMSTPTKDLLNAAGVDIIALIHGVAEDIIDRMNQYRKLP